METPALAALGSEASAEQLAALLQTQRARARELLAAGRMRLEQAEVFVEQRIQQLESELSEQRAETQRLLIARDALTARLAEAQRRLTERPDQGDGQPSAAEGELRHRCELAMEELREAKEHNSELQEQLAKTQSTAAKLAQQSGRLNWEAEKRRMLAALEAESDNGDAAHQAEHLEIRNVLRTTDEFVAAKNLQIEELTERLKAQEDSGATGAADASLTEQVLDNDAVIRQERERLEQLQTEWREKVRQAEVELALERANLARQRAELHRLRSAESVSPKPPANADESADRSAHGRWLARLGLTDADREPGRHF